MTAGVTPSADPTPWMEEPEVIPVDPRFEAVCPDCHLVFPKAIGCDIDHEAERKPTLKLITPTPLAA